ncbi:MAG: ribonuclease HI family protein [Candidatus Omnitrophica bacterium]|nr:ribonuclease HI family protein [Candidatus Omnitrophota bacterium]
MSKSLKRVTVYADGGARGNPGPAGIGVVILDDKGKKLRELSKSIGTATNNVAEYTAVIYGLQEALFLRADEVDVYLDSELVAEQLGGTYRVKNEGLRPLFEQAVHLMQGFKKVNVKNIPRDKNTDADRLVNRAINLSGLF